MIYALYIAALLSVLVPTTGAPLFAPAASDYASELASDEISSEDVREAAERFMAERFPEMSSRLQVRVERIGSRVESASSIRIRLTNSESIPKGRASVRLLARNGDSWEDAGWALLYVAHFDSVAIAQSSVSKGTALSDGDISFAWMETTTFRGQPLSPDEYRSLVQQDLYAARAIRAGGAVRVDDIRPPYAVETGQSLTMTYRKNGIELKMTCQAREPGLKGDVIRVYSPDSKSTYKVELTGPGAAQWISTL